MRRTVVLAVLVACLSGCATVRRLSADAMAGAGMGQPPGPLLPPGGDVALTDADLDRRLEFLTRALDAGRLHAAAWQWGWLAVNAGGGAASAAQAAFDSGTDRDYDIIEAGKSAIGVAYLLVAPMPGMHGADEIRDMPGATRADRVARLRRAEELLRAAAERSEQRTSWLMHLGNLGLNLAGGIALFALGDPEKAALSIGVDTAVGEVQIWTQPWDPAGDWRDYEHLVTTGEAPADQPSTSWHVGPRGPGIALDVRF